MIGLCVSLITDNFSSFIEEFNKKEILLSLTKWGHYTENADPSAMGKTNTFSFCFLPGDPGWPQMFKVDIDSATR